MKRGTETVSPAFAFRLDLHSGVPVYRQLIDQVQAGIAAGVLTSGEQLPTVRQVAVDLAINPNTAEAWQDEYFTVGDMGYLDEDGYLFIADRRVEFSKDERDRQLSQLAGEFVSRAGAAGFTLKQLIKALKDLQPE